MIFDAGQGLARFCAGARLRPDRPEGAPNSRPQGVRGRTGARRGEARG